MRTKRGGYKHTKQTPGTPRTKINGAVAGGGDFIVKLAVGTRITDRQRLAAIYGHVANWRQFGERHAIEPLDAGLKRYLRFPRG